MTPRRLFASWLLTLFGGWIGAWLAFRFLEGRLEALRQPLGAALWWTEAKLVVWGKGGVGLWKTNLAGVVLFAQFAQTAQTAALGFGLGAAAPQGRLAVGPGAGSLRQQRLGPGTARVAGRRVIRP